VEACVACVAFASPVRLLSTILAPPRHSVVAKRRALHIAMICSLLPRSIDQFACLDLSTMPPPERNNIDNNNIDNNSVRRINMCRGPVGREATDWAGLRLRVCDFVVRGKVRQRQKRQQYHAYQQIEYQTPDRETEGTRKRRRVGSVEASGSIPGFYAARLWFVGFVA